MATEIGRGIIPVSVTPEGIGGSLTAIHRMVATRLGATGVVGGAALATGIGAVIAGGVFLSKVGETFHHMRNIIVKETGASGKALEGLEKSARNIGKKTPASLEDVATAVGLVHARLGLVGKPLEKTTLQIIKLSRVTGTDLKGNVASITRLFGDWKVSASQQTGALDKLLYASQHTGIGVDELSQLMVKFGSPLRQLGFSFTTTAAMLGEFERSGVNLQTAMPGLRMALKNFAKDGKDPAKALDQTIASIKNASSTAKANTIAFKVFGTRAGPDMAAAIREGHLDLGKLVTGLQHSKGTLERTTASTRTAADAWKQFGNKVQIGLQPLASKVFGVFNDNAIKLADSLPKVGAAARRMFAAFTSGGGGKFGAEIRTTWAALQKLWASLVPVLHELAAAFVRNVLPALRQLGGAVANQLLPAFVRILPVITPVAKFLLRLFGDSLIGVVMGAIRVLKGVVGVVSGVFNLVADLIHGRWHKIWGDLLQILRGVFDLVIGAITVWWNLGILAIFKRGAFRLLFGWKGLFGGLKTLARDGLGLIKILVRSALDAVAGLFKGAIHGYTGLWTGLFKVLGRLAGLGFRAVRALFSGGFTFLRNTVRDAAAAMGRKWSDFWTGFRNLAGKLGDLIRTAIPRAFRAGRDSVRNFIGDIGTKWSNFWDGVRRIAGKLTDLIKNTIPRAFRAGRDAVGHIWDGLKALVKKPVQFIVNTVYMGGIYKVVGLLPGPNPLHPMHFRTGGRVPGTGSGDTVPTMLEPGELVVPKRKVTQRLVDWATSSVQHLKAGGRVVWPTIGRRVSTYPGHDGIDINQPPGPDFGAPIFAFRSGRVLYAGSGHGYGNAVFEAPDGGLPAVVYGHMSRNISRAGEMVKAGQRLGYVGHTGNAHGNHLHFGVPNGTAHQALQLLHGATRVDPGVGSGSGILGNFLSFLAHKVSGILGHLNFGGWIGKLAGKSLGPWGPIFGRVVSSVRHSVTDWIKHRAERIFGGLFGGLGHGGPVTSVGHGAKAVWSALRSTGLGKAVAAGIMGNIQYESGFDPRIVQGGGHSLHPASVRGGYGLVQWTPGRKLAAYIGGATPTVGNEIGTLMQQLRGVGTYPEAQAGRALAGIHDPGRAADVFGKSYERYAGGLQHGRASAAQFWFNHFDRGGILGNNRVGVNTSGGDERVLDRRTTRNFELLTRSLVTAPHAPSAVAAAGGRGLAMTITNWETGKGYIRWLAADEIGADHEFRAGTGRS